MVRLLERYKQTVVAELCKDLGRANILSIPRLEKIVVSMGVGQAVAEKKRIESATRELALLAGQKPVVCKAKKSVSNFKLRTGYPIGCKVTLRGDRMYEFLDRLISVVIPRIRDFRGLNPQAFDGQGNYSIGLTEQSVFPEIDIDNVDYTQGLNVTLVTTAKSDAEGKNLLARLGMPFRD
ncbi:MAG: 50S ribosomal protein L5 [Planctomycetes bacterium]|nr:50S ribosomal protein L5 [Planctomycetota bacterium]